MFLSRKGASLSSSPSVHDQPCAQPAVCATLAKEPDGVACCLDADPSQVVAVFGHEKAVLRPVPGTSCPTACTFEFEPRRDTALEDGKPVDVKLNTDSNSPELSAPGVPEHSTPKAPLRKREIGDREATGKGWRKRHEEGRLVSRLCPLEAGSRGLLADDKGFDGGVGLDFEAGGFDSEGSNYYLNMFVLLQQVNTETSLAVCHHLMRFHV